MLNSSILTQLLSDLSSVLSDSVEIILEDSFNDRLERDAIDEAAPIIEIEALLFKGQDTDVVLEPAYKEIELSFEEENDIYLTIMAEGVTSTFGKIELVLYTRDDEAEECVE